MGAVCAVAFWELARSCVKAGSSAVRLRALSSSSKASKPKAKPKSQARALTKAECHELSSLCDRDPSVPLPPEEAERFAALLAKLNNAGEQAPAQQQAPTSSSEAPVREASSSPRPSPGGQGPMPPQMQRPTCVDASIQTEPTFLRLTPDPGPPMPARMRSGKFHTMDHSSAHVMGETGSILTQTAGAYATSQTCSSEQCVPIACNASEPIWASFPAARESRLCTTHSLRKLSPPERAGSKKPAVERFLRAVGGSALSGGPKEECRNTFSVSAEL